MAPRSKYDGRISRNPEVMVGKPVVAGTRVPVDRVLRQLATELDIQDVLAAFPHLSAADVQACLCYAADVVEKASRPVKGATATVR